MWIILHDRYYTTGGQEFWRRRMPNVDSLRLRYDLIFWPMHIILYCHRDTVGSRRLEFRYSKTSISRIFFLTMKFFWVLFFRYLCKCLENITHTSKLFLFPPSYRLIETRCTGNITYNVIIFVYTSAAVNSNDCNIIIFFFIRLGDTAVVSSCH